MQDIVQVSHISFSLLHALIHKLLTVCRNLPKFDYFSQSDPICIVKYAKDSSKDSSSSAAVERSTPAEIFRSEVVANNSHPEFTTNFRFDPQHEKHKDFRFDPQHERHNDNEDSWPAPATMCFEVYDAK